MCVMSVLPTCAMLCLCICAMLGLYTCAMCGFEHACSHAKLMLMPVLC